MIQVGIVGVNHKTASLALREKLGQICERMFRKQNSSEAAFVLLNTCNRTEIYFSSIDLAETHTLILRGLRECLDEEFEHTLYSYFGLECFLHLCRVTAGLDSAIVAETEIQGQVKKEYESSSSWLLLSRELHFIFQKALKVGKNVRTTFLTDRDSFDLEHAICQIAQEGKDECEKKVLFVGASEINKKVIIHFSQKPGWKTFLCNRSEVNTLSFAKQHLIIARGWEEIDRWTDYDLVVFGTKSPGFLLKASDQDPAAKKVILIDLSVPRNVDPALGRITGVKLYNIQQIQKIVQQRQKKMGRAIALAERMVRDAVEAQFNLFLEREVNRKLWQTACV